MGALYIGIILLCRVAQHMANKKTSGMINGQVLFFHYAAARQVMSAFMALALILISRKGFYIDAKTVIISVFSGSMLVLSMFCSITAMKTGTMALSSLFSTAGLFIPCVAGIVLFNQPVNAFQWLGLLLFVFSAYLLIASSKKIFNGFSVKTFLLLLGVLVSNGLTMLAQQMFTAYVPCGDVSVFSFLSFGTVGVVLFAALPFVSKMSNEKVAPLPKNLLFFGVILSVAVFIINQLATLSTAFVPPVILFTFINGGSTVIAAIVAATVYKEKITLQSAIGIVIGVTAMVIIKIFG